MRGERRGVSESAPGVTRAEYCAVACAEVFRGDGEVMASAFGTAPAIGRPAGPADLRPRPRPDRRGRRTGRRGAAPRAGADGIVLESHMPYRRVFDVVWSGRRNLIMMASQIDRTGNQNISAIGEWARPKAQLVGVRGAPGNTVNHSTSYWVPNHSTRSFVEQVDVVSGVGYARAAEAGPSASRFHEIRHVVSNLGVFDFETPEQPMRLRSVHPGVTVDEVVGGHRIRAGRPVRRARDPPAHPRGARADPRPCSTRGRCREREVPT